MAGEARATVAKVKHAVRMFSLDIAYSRDELAEFVRRVNDGLPTGAVPVFCVEPKLDGANIEVIYEGGHLVQAEHARGDGETGEEDITVNVRTHPRRAPDHRTPQKPRDTSAARCSSSGAAMIA